MLRSILLALGLTIGAAGAAAAEALPGRVEAEWKIPSGLGFGLFADVGRGLEHTGAGRHIVETAAAGVSWRLQGLRLSAAAGFQAYDYSGVGEGNVQLATFAAAYVLPVAPGMSLSVEMRQTTVLELETRTDVTTARLGWAVRF
jgi:hypothetical protein